MTRLATIIMVALSTVLLTSGRLAADLYSGTIPFVNSSVDVTFTGDITGTETLIVDQGEVSLELTGSAGVYSALTLTGGTFDLADDTMTLTQVNPPGPDLTLTITGFGFDVLNSVFSLTATANPDEYTIAGDINVLANQGSMFEPVSGLTYDFSTNPEGVTATLLNTSTITINDPVPDDGLLDISADLRFGGEELAPYNIGGFVTGTIDVSSVNTLSLQGGLTAIPEPSTSGLLLLGLLGLCTGVRRRSRI